jgi:hypothetical protein
MGYCRIIPEVASPTTDGSDGSDSSDSTVSNSWPAV